MKQLLLDFWDDSKAMAIANPWTTVVLIVAATTIGWVAGTF